MTETRKSTILARVREGRAEFEAALARLDPAQMAVARPPVGWSVKDMLAHITFWEQYAIDRWGEALRGETPRLITDFSEDYINRLNQEALDAGRAKSWDQVQTEFAQVHAALVAQVEKLPDDPGDPFWSMWSDPEIVWKLVEWNTYGHYLEHMDTLRAWAGA